MVVGEIADLMCRGGKSGAQPDLAMALRPVPAGARSQVPYPSCSTSCSVLGMGVTDCSFLQKRSDLALGARRVQLRSVSEHWGNVLIRQAAVGCGIVVAGDHVTLRYGRLASPAGTPWVYIGMR